MKILIYSANFAPEQTGIGKYSGETAAWFAGRGDSVRVIAAPPYYPAWRLDAGYRWPPYRREQWAEVDVWRAPLWVPAKPGGFSRALHLASFAASSLPLALLSVRWRPDVVLTVAPFLMCAPTGWLIARLSGAKAWLHIQDFEVDAAFELGLLKGRFLKRLVLGFERWLLLRYDVVSTISNRMVQRLHDKQIPPERLRLFSNWVDTEAIHPLPATSTYRTELQIGMDKVVVLFSGTLGPKQGLASIPLVAAKIVRREDVFFVICGDGVMRPQLEKSCAGLLNVRLLPLQPAERLCDLLNLADIHLLTQSPEAEDLVLPSKLTGMLASGRPVVATCREGSEIASVVERCGEVVVPGDVDALAAAIERLADDPRRRQVLGAQARAYVEHNLAKDVVLERMSRSLADVADGRLIAVSSDRG